MKDNLLVYINKQELLCKLFVFILCTIMSILSGSLYFLLNVKGALAA